jgi:DNA-damage-inducible protein D
MESQVYASTEQSPLPAPDARMRETDCANRETVLRIIQSIPSLNAEPFKQWLANVGALA